MFANTILTLSRPGKDREMVEITNGTRTRTNGASSCLSSRSLASYAGSPVSYCNPKLTITPELSSEQRNSPITMHCILKLRTQQWLGIAYKTGTCVCVCWNESIIVGYLFVCLFTVHHSTAEFQNRISPKVSMNFLTESSGNISGWKVYV